MPPPATIGRLVEVICYEHAAEASIQRALAWVDRLGKTGVRTRDKAGFVVNRLQRAWLNAGLRLLEEGGGTPATLDAALRSEGGFPAGPFELMDSRGLTEDYSIGETIYELLGRSERLKPSEVHQKLLARGCRGRRNSRGFYAYGENAPGTVNPLVGELVPGYATRPVAATAAA
ncbi:MAG: 3-hydroxybutyryl-CoA dehydrogenase, partial [Elusimicrobia bacterium]